MQERPDVFAGSFLFPKRTNYLNETDTLYIDTKCGEGPRQNKEINFYKKTTMKRIMHKLCFACLGLFLIQTSCGNGTPQEPNPNPDGPEIKASKVSIWNNGLKTHVIGEDDNEFSYLVNVAKEQGEPLEATTVTLEYSPDALAAYIAAHPEAAEFTAIPESAADFPRKVNIGKEETSNKINVNFDMDALRAAVTPGETLKFIYPIKITGATGENVTINPAKDNILLGITVYEEVPEDDGEWVFNIKIMLDKKSFEEKYYESEEAINTRLGLVFAETNAIWNGKLGTPYFANKFRYVPHFDAATGVYDCSSTSIFDNVQKANKERGDYDVLIIMDGYVGDHPDERMVAGYATAQKSIYMPSWQNTRDLLGKDVQWTGETIAHEFAHFRGAPDLYSMQLSVENNTINGEPFEPVPCMTSTNHGGIWMWADFTVGIINRNTDKLDSKDFVKLEDSMPTNIEMAVTRGGQPVSGAEVNVYTYFQYQWSPISTTPVFEGTTSAEGTYHFPSSYYYTQGANGWPVALTIMEVIDPLDANNKKYHILAQYEVIMAYFEGARDKMTIPFEL